MGEGTLLVLLVAEPAATASWSCRQPWRSRRQSGSVFLTANRCPSLLLWVAGFFSDGLPHSLPQEVGSVPPGEAQLNVWSWLSSFAELAFKEEGQQSDRWMMGWGDGRVKLRIGNNLPKDVSGRMGIHPWEAS